MNNNKVSIATKPLVYSAFRYIENKVWNALAEYVDNAVMCLNNGVKMENVSKMLGHTNVRTTQQYAKVLNAEVEKDFEMLERILS